MGSTILA